MNIEIKQGLLPTKTQNTGFSFGAAFGYTPLEELPDKFRVADPLEIKHQGNTQCCVPYSLCTTIEPQEKVIINPAFAIKTISKITGDSNWHTKGTSLKVGADASLIGFLAKDESPYTLEKDGIARIANPQNWTITHNTMAKNHAKKAYFWIGVSGRLTMFDAIRSSMYRFKNEKRAVQTGLMWYQNFTHQTYIKDIVGRIAGGHAISIYGWNGDYLEIVQSYGTSIGQNGIQYIHKSVVNELFKYKAVYYQDMPEGETKESLLKKSRLYRGHWLLNYLNRFMNLIINN